MRKLWIRDDGYERAEEGFARSQRQMALAASRGVALMRLHRRGEPAVSLGRFHRMRAGGRGLERRLTGGRAVSIGPGVLGVTLAVPSVDWLQPGGPALRPDQVLNRCLRPVLSMLRPLGADVFYPGRDLLTAGGHVVGVASFTIAPDGGCLAEAFLSLDMPFSRLSELLPTADPDGVATVDPAQYRDSVALRALVGPLPHDARWLELLARFSADTYGAAVEPWPRSQETDPSACGRPAFDAFQEERGPLPDGAVVASSVAMLGVVEAAARLCHGNLTDLTVTGDLIAPFHTLDEISRVLEGQPPKPPLIRRKVATVLSRPRSFVLGMQELDELIARLAL